MSPVRLNGSTSGYSELSAPAVAGNNTITLPTGAGSANQFLKNGATAGSLGYSSVVEDSSGRLLVGTSTARSNIYNASYAPVVQIETYGALTERTLSLAYNNGAASPGGPVLNFITSRGSTAGSNTVVASGDELGAFNFTGTDGTRPTIGAAIAAYVDGTPGNLDMPGRLVFSTTPDGSASPAERMRIDSSGVAMFNTTSQLIRASETFRVNGGTGIASFQSNGSGIPVIAIRNTNAVATYQIAFNNNTTECGTITTGTNSVAYNTSSDYRLKENIVPISDGILRLLQLKPSRFNFKVDPKYSVDGFIAHEAQEVVPECATGKKDAVDDDGNPKYQGIDQSKLVPLLTAALQEAIAKIETQGASIAALEARLTALEVTP